MHLDLYPDANADKHMACIWILCPDVNTDMYMDVHTHMCTVMNIDIATDINTDPDRNIHTGIHINTHENIRGSKR